MSFIAEQRFPMSRDLSVEQKYQLLDTIKEIHRTTPIKVSETVQCPYCYFIMPDGMQCQNCASSKIVSHTVTAMFDADNYAEHVPADKISGYTEGEPKRKRK
jgi:DNA-directed RNA polymerase subunit RPC12/RpoP